MRTARRHRPFGVLLASAVLCATAFAEEPPSPSPPPDPSSCPDASPQEAQLGLSRDQYDFRRNELSKLWDGFQTEWNQAQQLRSDYELVIRSCALWDIGMKLAEFTVSEGGEGGKAFVELHEIVKKVLEQDPSVVLGIAPEIDGVKPSEVWETVMAVREGASSAAAAGSVSGMKEKLEQCAGTPMVSDLVWQDAKSYLDHLGDALGRLPAIHEKMSQIDHQADDLWNWQQKVYTACMDHWNCLGVAGPPDCTAPPPGPG